MLTEINSVFPQASGGFRPQTDIPSCMKDSAKGQTVFASFSYEITPSQVTSTPINLSCVQWQKRAAKKKPQTGGIAGGFMWVKGLRFSNFYFLKNPGRNVRFWGLSKSCLYLFSMLFQPKNIDSVQSEAGSCVGFFAAFSDKLNPLMVGNSGRKWHTNSVKNINSSHWLY